MMKYPSELEQMLQERETEHYRKRKCTAAENGGCYCTGRCYYTQEEWEELEKLKEKVKFTGVQEMKNKMED